MSSATGSAPPSAGGARAYTGPVRWAYRPSRNGRPDPGEIVWTWVAFEENPSLGKDRPVVVIGLANRRRLAVLMLSSRNHAGDPHWLPIGAGAWDNERRPSWVRGDRVLAVEAHAIRREGALLPREIYESIRAGVGHATPSVMQRFRRALRLSGGSSSTP